jgi:hypothetical protein
MSQNFIYKFIWILQKSYRRNLKFISTVNKSVSFRKSQVNNAIIYKKTPEKLNFYNYKTNFNHKRVIFGLKNVFLNPKSGIVWYKNKIVEESTIWQVSNLFKWEPRPIYAKNLSGRFTCLPDNGYFHFVIEDLPRFIDVINLKTNFVTIYGSNSKYVLSALKILNIENPLFLSHPAKCEEVIISEKSIGGIFSTIDRKKLLSFSKNIMPAQKYDKIFISRKNHSNGMTQRIAGEVSKIESLFAKQAFKIMYFEDLDFPTQISLAKGASVIAGIHGAGLANLVWNTSRCKVIEVSESRITSHFSYLANVCNHSYLFFKSSELVNYSKKEFSDLIS